jgi:hypothetical protein
MSAAGQNMDHVSSRTKHGPCQQQNKTWTMSAAEQNMDHVSSRTKHGPCQHQNKTWTTSAEEQNMDHVSSRTKRGPCQQQNKTWTMSAAEQNVDHVSSRTKHGPCQQQNKTAYWFLRRVLRKIYGPIQNSDGTWRIKTNEELGTLIKKENIVRFIKSQRLRWAAHVIRMDTTRTVK